MNEAVARIERSEIRGHLIATARPRISLRSIRATLLVAWTMIVASGSGLDMRTFWEKALLIALDALGSVALLITAGMLAFLVGSVGAFFGFMYAKQHDFPVSVQYGVAAICALLLPVWLCVWLWQRAIRPDDEPPRSS